MPFEEPNRFTQRLFRVWLQSRLTSGARVISGRLPDMPNRVVGIIPVQGPGLVMDGEFDVVAMQIQSRGAENNIDDAEAIAHEVDNVMIGTDPNFWIGNPSHGVWCNRLGRTGGGPALLSPLPDPQSRFTFVTTYYAEVSTNIGQVI